MRHESSAILRAPRLSVLTVLWGTIVVWGCQLRVPVPIAIPLPLLMVRRGDCLEVLSVLAGPCRLRSRALGDGILPRLLTYNTHNNML